MRPLRESAAVVHLMRRRVGELVRARGVAGSAIHCARNIGGVPQRLRMLLQDAAYDRTMGVQTSRLVPPANLGVDPGKLDDVATGASGNAYMPSPTWVLAAAFKELNIHYPDYSFIDLGSGMGRILLMAAEFPFAKVVGVEFSRELHDIAVENLARASGPRRAAAVESILQDAREYVPPPGNCLVYMFNPFRENVMTKVLENLKRQVERLPAELYIVYLNPVLGALLDESPFLVRIARNRYYAIYHARGK